MHGSVFASHVRVLAAAPPFRDDSHRYLGMYLIASIVI